MQTKGVVGLALSLCLFTIAGPLASAPSQQQAAQPTIAEDGTLTVPGFKIPFSTLASEEARRRLVDRATHPLPVTPGNVQKTRRDLDEQFHAPLLKALRAQFPVTITPRVIGGVQTDIVAPSGGIAPRNDARLLLNLHGGSFQQGARLGGQIESVPIAALGKINVVTIDYRLGPEHRFPAASEDVAAVYRELLNDHRPENIGIYGCSAGGMLTAEALAWFQSHNLPAPGAAGIFGGGAMVYLAGDSIYTSTVLDGRAPMVPVPSKDTFRAYFGDANVMDPLVSPVHDPAILARFPPTLIVSGGRDVWLSSALHTHRKLVSASVPTDLHVWEGMGHCFIYYPELPESREAWQVIVDFFDEHLGVAAREPMTKRQ